MQKLIKNIDDYGDTIEYLANLLKVGDCLLLQGEMGIGKTHLARSLIRYLTGKPDLSVPSPTFSLLNIYEGQVPIYHYDLYRIECESELLELGFEEAFASGISLIEWGDILGSRLPRHAYRLRIEELPKGQRNLILENS